MARSGRCHICGEYKRLTDEHIPPRSALNESPICIYSGEEALRNDDKMPWDLTDKKGRPMHKGVKFRRLCLGCNGQLTGANYVPAYSDFVRQAFILLQRGVPIEPSGFGTFEFSRISPLRIAKQVVAMFLGINAPEIGDAQPELRKFVMRKEQRGLSPKKYGLYMFIAGGQLSRYCGLSVLLRGFGSDSRSIRSVSELTSFPLGFLLEINPKEKEKQLADILFFANQYDLEEENNIRLELPVREVNTVTPLDYRSQKEVTVDYVRNMLDEVQRKYQMR